MSLQEHEAQALAAFKSNVEDLALEELARLEGERDQLASALADVKEAIKSVRAVLTATRPPREPKKKKAAGSGSGFSMSEEREAAVIEWLTINDAEITSRSLKEHFPDWSDSYCNMALKLLRERDGLLRLAGRAGSMNIYRSMI